MTAKYVAGLYIFTRENGDRYHVKLSASEARTMFRIYNALGFVSVDLETPYN